jgi:membrane protease YdiL (CAAX protease family)
MTSPEPPHQPSQEVPVWVPFVALAAVLVVVSIIGAALYGVISASDPAVDSSDDLPDGATLALVFVQDLVFVFAAFVAVKLTLGRATREQFGLVRVRDIGSVLRWAAAAYAAFWLVASVLAAIFGQPDDQQLVTDIKEEETLAVLVSWAILICVLAPVVEELFFRGFMFTVFARRMPIVWAALLDGVVFGLGHAPADPIQLVALGAFGVALCLLYWRAQSIIPGMALHALNNSITFGVAKGLGAAAFAAVVVLCVGTVVAGASALSRRSAVAA